MDRILIIMVRVYQKIISPLCPGVCRYKPCCSEYMIQAIKTHGCLRGFFLGCKRIIRCHPWGGSGYDPVPPKEEVEKK